MLKRSLALAAGIALSLSAALAHAETLKELKVSAIPDEAPTELLRKFKPLGAYLEKQLGMPVKFVRWPTTPGWSRRWPPTAWTWPGWAASPSSRRG